MGTFINFGNGQMKRTVARKIYVDKSMLLSLTNEIVDTDECFVCVSRPRRFGKTMAANMIAAYYDESCDSRDLFSNLKIAQDPSFEEHLNKYPVIRIDMAGFSIRAQDKNDIIGCLQKSIIEELATAYPSVLTDEATLADALFAIYQKTGKRFVIVIDEWDALFREYPNELNQQEDYLNMLRLMFKDFSLSTSIALCYMTGILPIKKYKTQSALNNFKQYSMLEPLDYAPFVGFSEEEVKELCSQHDMDFEEMKRWYDGYSFSSLHSVYSPYSVINSLQEKKYKNYWSESSSFDDVKDFINMNFDGLKDDVIHMLSGGRCKLNTRTFANDFVTLHDKDQVMTLLIHLGYLAYDEKSREAYVPNLEVSQQLADVISMSDWGFASDAIKQSEELLSATWKFDGEKVSSIIESFHDGLSSFMSYNKESDLALVIKLAYYAAERYYQVKREMVSGKGYADVSFVPRKNTDVLPMIIELKWNSGADSAIDQIKAREYAKGFPEYPEVLVCGISYDTESKKHSCRIEKISN